MNILLEIIPGNAFVQKILLYTFSQIAKIMDKMVFLHHINILKGSLAFYFE